MVAALSLNNRELSNKAVISWHTKQAKFSRLNDKKHEKFLTSLRQFLTDNEDNLLPLANQANWHPSIK